VGQIQIRK